MQLSLSTESGASMEAYGLRGGFVADVEGMNISNDACLGLLLLNTFDQRGAESSPSSENSR